MPALATDSGLIFDVGLHRGQDTRFYLDMGYRVVAVEAEPGLVEAARRMFAPEIADQRLAIVHCAISGEDGPVPFWVSPTRTSGTQPIAGTRSKASRPVSGTWKPNCPAAGSRPLWPSSGFHIT